MEVKREAQDDSPSAARRLDARRVPDTLLGNCQPCVSPVDSSNKALRRGLPSRGLKELDRMIPSGIATAPGSISTSSLRSLQASLKAADSLQRTVREFAKAPVARKHVVDLMVDYRNYSSNLELVKSVDEQVGTILDVLG